MTRLSMLALCALLLSGCLNWRGPHHPAAGGELYAAGSAVEAWEAAGRALPADDCTLLDRIEIVIVAPYPEGRSPCIYIEDGQRRYGAACLRVVQPHVGAPATLAIYLNDDLDERGRQNGIAHEVLHRLRDCAAQGALRVGDELPWPGVGADAEHVDLELWGAIQNEALRLLE
jgi:hypothetical protein